MTMPRVELTLAKKYELLLEIESHPPKTSQCKLAKLTGVSRDTIRRLLRNSDKIKEEWAMNEGKPPSSQKRKRIGLYPEIDEALYNWFSLVQAHGERITRITLQRKAKELAISMNRLDFKATDGWIFRWKRRHEIAVKQALTDGNSINYPKQSVRTLNVSGVCNIEEEEVPEQLYQALEAEIEVYDVNRPLTDVDFDPPSNVAYCTVTSHCESPSQNL